MFNKTQLAIVSGALVAAPVSVYADNYTFDEVVVSASRTEISKQDAPSSIETVSSEQMEKMVAGDIKQVLTHSPGVDVNGSGRFGISGFTIRGIDDSRIKMMVDGVQQPVPYNPGANEQRKYPNAIELDTLQSIEVNKGPSSTLYGSDALGGVVLLRTKNPADFLLTSDDEHRFAIKSGYSSANEEFKNTLSWAMRKDKLETLLMATYAIGSETETHGSGSKVEGPKRGAANPADSKLSNLLAKAFYQLNEDHRIGLIFEHYNKQYDEDELSYNGYELSMGPGMSLLYADNRNEDTNKRTRVGLEHQMQMTSQLADSLDWSLSFQDSSTLSKNYDTTSLYGQRLRERDSSDKSIQFDSQLSKIVMLGDNPHQLTYGANYLHNDFKLDNTDYKSATGTVTPGATGVPDATVTQWGVYLQDQTYQMDDKLVLTAGIRYDSYKANPKTDKAFPTDFPQNSDSAVTAKLGSVYHLNDNLSLFGQISQGFKAPTVRDIYYFYAHGAIIEANPDLKAERSLAYELGLRGHNDQARFELTTFYTDYRDFIEQVIVGERDSKSIYSKKNIDKVKIYGAELSSELRLDKMFNAPDGVYSRLSISYVDGEDKKTGNSLDSVAPITGVVGFGIDRDSYGSELNLKMVAGKDEWMTEDHTNAPGYSVVDLTAYYKPIEDLTISAGLFNLLDKKYWLYEDLGSNEMSKKFNIDGKSQPGRNWAVTLNYQF